MTQSRFVGVDGCPEGWFSVGLDGRGRYEVGVFKTFKELLDRYAGAELVLVDIPIGLPEGAGGRDCDREARRRLEARRSSVFPTPTRRTVEQAARSPWDYRRALEVERQFAGKGISQQAFRIAPKIAQVDRALLERGPNATPQVREVHPELCLWALNHKRPMKYGKKKAEGEKERLEVLQGIEPHAREIFDAACSRFLRKVVARDDIVDALALAVTGHRGHGQLRAVPDDPPKDARGLPMEIVYWDPVEEYDRTFR